MVSNKYKSLMLDKPKWYKWKNKFNEITHDLESDQKSRLLVHVDKLEKIIEYERHQLLSDKYSQKVAHPFTSLDHIEAHPISTYDLHNMDLLWAILKQDRFEAKIRTLMIRQLRDNSDDDQGGGGGKGLKQTAAKVRSLRAMKR